MAHMLLASPRRLTSALAIACALAAAAAQAQEISVAHAQGETVLAAAPRKVAVYDLASLDTLNALGVDVVAGVPRPADGAAPSWPQYLQGFAAEEYAPIGTLFEPDIAALEALAPDLIIIGGRSASNYEALSALAPTIDLSTGTEDFTGDVIRNAELLGRIFGEEAAAAERVAELEATLADLRAKAADAGTGLVVFAAGENASAQPPGSRFGIVYDLVGIEPAIGPAETAAAGPRPEAGSPEAAAARERQIAATTAALAADPDWLFVLDRNAAFGEESDLAARLAADPRFAETTAWTGDQVYHLDAPSWYLVGGGLDAVQNAAEEIGAAFAATGL